MNNLKRINDYELGNIKKFDKYKENLMLIDDKVILSLIHISEPTRPY